MDPTFQYPPDLFNLLIETIPRLVRSKRDVLLFLRGAGVRQQDLADLESQVAAARTETNKFAIVRTVLTRLNEQGDRAIGARRELLKRVVEFEDFTGCYENERDAAKARVAEVRQLVNVKDSFTRMQIEREREAEARRVEARERLGALERARAKREAAKDELFAVFGEPEPARRGKRFESALNALFAAEGIGVREAFTITGASGSIEEQIDGVIDLDGHLYLVEAKWLSGPADINEVSRHIVRVMGRADCGGLFVSAEGFTDAAVQESRRALAHRAFVLCRLDELVRLLESERDLSDFLREKLRAAVLDRDPARRIV